MTYPGLPEADLHVHTLASGHAYSTIGEIAAEAARKGLKGIGMTDHGPALPGGPHPYHFAALRFVPTHLFGVRIFRGVEANIIGEGVLDLEEELLEKLDLVMAGFHEGCGFDDLGREANTRAVLALMAQPRVKVIVHPGNPNFPLDYEAVARRGLETGTALEINNSSFSVSRKGSMENCRRIIELCARLGTPISLASDAHIAQRVGEFADALQELANAGVKWEQVVNRTLVSTLAFLGLPE
ncbi:phosphatase [Desulfuromonas versatilis]|uniref:Phosphatase n=1 Tax=Desulfuromonas versatilis TaxID=2802975 RepID=A0ABM8HPI9_9BACT|nr:PHP domain-containing protein [Desulfuromonas versatilis]BCR03609.1 phosphatase [Desulfuromonas versatilis]